MSRKDEIQFKKKIAKENLQRLEMGSFSSKLINLLSGVVERLPTGRDFFGGRGAGNIFKKSQKNECYLMMQLSK